MRRARPAALVLAAAILLAGAAAATDRAGSREPRAAAAANPMHPLYELRDSLGRPLPRAGGAVSVERTCGACHDADYIAAHDSHRDAGVRTTCVDCHARPGDWPPGPAALDADGRVRRGAVELSSPRNENCATCHQVVHAGREPLRVPDDFESPEGAAARGFTLHTGSVFSWQSPAGSFLNLRGKSRQVQPWDVHAERFVRCVDCHGAPNDPGRADARRSGLDFVVRDPRRLGISEYLHRPDHRLAAADCRDCHDPLRAHESLPYRERHLEVLDCRACHVPHVPGPAARSIDGTVVREDGAPVVTYRGASRDDGAPLNAAFLEGYEPLLVPRRDERTGTTKLAPFNAVDRWSWASAVDGAAVPAPLVRAAYLEGGRHAPAIVAAFDRDGDGTVRGAELRLDSPAKRDLVAARLQALGVREPVLQRAVTLHPLVHGVQSGASVRHDCASCHTKHSRLRGQLALSDFAPAGAAAPGEVPVTGPGVVPGSVMLAAAGGDASRLEARLPDDVPLFVFGHSRREWIVRTGMGIFTAVVVAVGVHALLRVRSRRRHPVPPAPARRAYLYSFYERAWHWLMAMSVLALLATGLQIEFFGRHEVLPLPTAVAVHNFFAVVLTANAVLALFYHVTTEAIRKYIPPRDGLAQKVAAQADYYARGIFAGRPHPHPRSEKRRLNPMQQLTYLALLNVLFPMQLVTGFLIWGVARWPRLADAIGGLSVIAPVHTLGSWLFFAFFVLHVYLTTTGHSVLSHAASMLHGYGEVELEAEAPAGGSHA